MSGETPTDEIAAVSGRSGGRSGGTDFRLLSQDSLGEAATALPSPAPSATPGDAAAVAAPVLEPEPPPPPPPLSVPWAPMVCPVQGPLEFIDSWGYARSGGRSHKGTDMMSQMGVWTVAPVDGVVVHGSNGLGGLTWHLYGDDGNTYYGAHLSGFENEGIGRVRAGTVIGYVGDSGNAAGTPPHLHFEIRPGGGAAVNPYETLVSIC